MAEADGEAIAAAGGASDSAGVDRSSLGFGSRAVTRNNPPPNQRPLVAPIYATSVFCPRDFEDAGRVQTGVSSAVQLYLSVRLLHRWLIVSTQSLGPGIFLNCTNGNVLSGVVLTGNHL